MCSSNISYFQPWNSPRLSMAANSLVLVSYRKGVISWVLNVGELTVSSIVLRLCNVISFPDFLTLYERLVPRRNKICFDYVDIVDRRECDTYNKYTFVRLRQIPSHRGIFTSFSFCLYVGNNYRYTAV